MPRLFGGKDRKQTSDGGGGKAAAPAPTARSKASSPPQQGKQRPRTAANNKNQNEESSGRWGSKLRKAKSTPTVSTASRESSSSRLQPTKSEKFSKNKTPTKSPSNSNVASRESSSSRLQSAKSEKFSKNKSPTKSPSKNNVASRESSSSRLQSAKSEKFSKNRSPTKSPSKNNIASREPSSSRLQSAKSEKFGKKKPPTKSPSKNKRGEEQVHVVYEEFGDEAKFQLKVRTKASAPSITGPNQVIIKVKSSTVSMKDCIIRRGMWKDGPAIELSASPGYDCVGTIYDLCPSVADDGDFKVGDTVATIARTGGNAKYVTVPSPSSLIKIPPHSDPDKAACIVSAYITAYQALYRSWPGSDGKEHALQNKRVLIVAGHQPVGLAAIELCKLGGAKQIYATAEENHHAFLKNLGAIPLPYHPDFWLYKVEGTIDLALDGACQDNYDSPRASLKEGGYLVCLGADAILMNDQDTGIGVTKGGWFKKQASAKLAGLKASYMGQSTNYEAWKSWKENPVIFQQDIDYLFALLKKGKIRPRISNKTVRLDQVAFFHHLVEDDKIKEGSVIVKPWKKG